MDSGRLAEISSFDELGDFACLELDALTTLDFQLAADEGGVRWAGGEPVRYDPEGGLAIFKSDERGLVYVLSRTSGFDLAGQADLRRLAAFVRTHGSSHLYELATL